MKIEDTYFGGKGGAGTYQFIINQIAKHDIFISPFLGYCKISQHIKNAKEMIGFDLDKNVIKAWQGIKWMKVKEYDALAFLSSFIPDSDKNYCLFLDPPYPLQTRISKHRYKYEFSQLKHDFLLETMKSISDKYSNVQILICTLPNQSYSEKLSGWHKLTYKNLTRAGQVKEHLFINKLANGVLHDYSYTGQNFTDRQRIKRKANRWVNNLSKLPPQERNAILEQIKLKYYAS